MIAAIWFLLASSTYAPWVSPERAPACAVWIVAGTVAAGHGLERAMLAASWARGESGCNPAAVNPQSGACGLINELGPGRRGHSCAELVADPVLSVRVWHEDVDEGIAKCGSLRGGLRYASSGTCSGLPALVSYRCALAEVEC